MKRIICVTAVGKAESLLPVTRSNVQDYAHSIGVDCVYRTKLGTPWQQVYKYDLVKHCCQLGYDEICMLDVDIIIRKGAPNVFHFLGDAGVSANGRTEDNKFMQEKIAPGVKELIGSFDYRYYRNTGVTLFRADRVYQVTGKMQELWDLQLDLKCGDETYFAAACQSIGLLPDDLPIQFNYAFAGPWKSRPENVRLATQNPDIQFYHFNGPWDRKKSVLTTITQQLKTYQ